MFDPNMLKNIFDLNTLKVIKDLTPESTRELLFNPAANEVGKGVGAILSILFSPLLALNVIEKQALAKFTNKIANKINKIPEEDQDFSKPGLALKALEEARYQINNELLQDMFSSLLASGVNRQKNEDITPRYATVLSQIGYKDAVFLQEINDQDYHYFPIGHLRHTNISKSEYIEVTDRYLCNNNNEIKRIPTESIDVLQSLGIIQQEDNHYKTGGEFDKKYALLESYLQTQDKYKANNDNDIPFVRMIPGQIQPTDFGNHLLYCIFE